MDSRFHGNDGKRSNTASFPSFPRALCHLRAPSIIPARLVSSPRPVHHPRVPSVISVPRPSSPSPPSVIPAKAGIHPRIPCVIPVLLPSLAPGRGVKKFPDTSASGLTNLKTEGWIPVFTGMTERDPTRHPLRHSRAPCVISVPRPSSPRPVRHPRAPSIIPASRLSSPCPVHHPRAPSVIPIPSFSHSRGSGNPSPHSFRHSRPSSVPCVGQGSRKVSGHLGIRPNQHENRRMDSRFHGNDEKRPNTASSPSFPRPLCHLRAPSIIPAPRPSSPSPPSVIPAKAGIHPRNPSVIPASLPSSPHSLRHLRTLSGAVRKPAPPIAKSISMVYYRKNRLHCL